jgi:WD40 repeat protein
MKKLTVGRGNFHAVAYDAGGRFLASLNSARVVRFWDLTTFQQVLSRALSLPADREWPTLFWSGDRLAHRSGLWDITPIHQHLRRLAAGAAGKQAAPPGGCTPIHFQGDGPRSHLRLVADGPTLAGHVWEYQSSRGSLCLWDAAGRCSKQLSWGQAWRQRPLAVRGNLLALADGYDAVLLDLSSNEEVAHLTHSDYPQRAAFSRDGRLLGTAAGRSAWLWDLDKHQPLGRFPAFSKHVDALAFHPTGRLFAAGGRDGEVRLWDTASLKEVARYNWGVGAVHGLAFAPDGATAAAAGHDNAIAIWDLE